MSVDELDELKECPFCAELIRVKAVLCKHCKSSLEVAFHDEKTARAGARSGHQHSRADNPIKASANNPIFTQSTDRALRLSQKHRSTNWAASLVMACILLFAIGLGYLSIQKSGLELNATKDKNNTGDAYASARSQGFSGFQRTPRPTPTAAHSDVAVSEPDLMERRDSSTYASSDGGNAIPPKQLREHYTAMAYELNDKAQQATIQARMIDGNGGNGEEYLKQALLLIRQAQEYAAKTGDPSLQQLENSREEAIRQNIWECQDLRSRWDRIRANDRYQNAIQNEQ
jgi:hypothetical protein